MGEILKDKQFQIEMRTAFEEYNAIIIADQRSVTLDPGNIKMSFNSMHEKAEAREKERAKKEEREARRRESSFRTMLKQAAPPLELGDKWDEVRDRFENEEAFISVTLESERIRLSKNGWNLIVRRKRKIRGNIRSILARNLMMMRSHVVVPRRRNIVAQDQPAGLHLKAMNHQ